MALILSNESIAPGIFALSVALAGEAAPGQFFELYTGDCAHLLPRPISVFDSSAEAVTFVYRVAGFGTDAFSKMKAGEELRLTGPLGHGFPEEAGAAVIIGGGLGIAPMRYLAKKLRESDPARDISIYLGYSGEVFLKERFEEYGRVKTDVGGYITDKIDFSRDAVYYACGPEPMLRAAAKKAAGHKRTLYVSLERRMACGVGACLGCSVETASGMKRVCADGPVFPASEVYYG